MPLNATYGGAGGASKISKSTEVSRETITAQDKDGKIAVYKIKYGKSEESIESTTQNPTIPNLFEGKLTGPQITSYEIRLSNTDLPKVTETKTTLTNGQ